MIGRTLSHYRITADVGHGGMGVVYRARDERLERDVALKVLVPGLLADDSARRRFRKEALALSTLNHPNIQTVHDFDTEAEVDFLVTEYVPGVTLTERVTAGALPEKEVLRLGVQLADGLAAAHAHGIIHRDLKPANLRVTPDGRLKILDFGLARAPAVADAATTRSLGDAHTLAGTLPYMAPEQLRGETLDVRTDLFAAGCVLYELSTGRRAFVDELAPRLTDAILHDDPVAPRVINPQMSPELERIVLKCVEKDPGERYQSATELGVDLRRLEAGRVVLTTTSGGPVAKRRRFLGWAGGAAAAALLAGVLAIATSRWRAVPVSDREPARIRSLAVLPLTNLTGDSEQEYFVAGMQDALIAELGQIGALAVISRTSTMRYRNTEKTVPEIARELRVDALVEGSTFREGENVRIQVQLIGAAPVERKLWSGTYDGDLRHVLTLQKRVSRAIADQIQVKLTPEEASRFATARRAIEIDTDYAYAYLRLGHAYIEKGLYNDAIAVLEKGARVSGEAVTFRAALARAYAFAGRRLDARRILAELLTEDRRGYVERIALAIIYASLGDKDEALRRLEEGFQMRESNMVLIKVHPFWDPLRADPRFQDLLRRMKFPD